MTENKGYLALKQEHGSILISEEVIASIAALAVREVEGVYGLSVTQTLDLSGILGKKNLRRGIYVAISEEGIVIACNLIVKVGMAVMEVAKNVQEAIADEISSITGVRPLRVDVNICGVAAPKSAGK